MLLTRYELSFYGELQNIGFIQGLKDQNLSNKTIDSLIEQFNQYLVIPNFSILKPLQQNEYLASFFTLKGLSFFSNDIKKITKFIERKDNGWEVETIEMESTEVNNKIIYQDEYQIILSIPYK